MVISNETAWVNFERLQARPSTARNGDLDAGRGRPAVLSDPRLMDYAG
jgi:hypothetical protein